MSLGINFATVCLWFSVNRVLHGVCLLLLCVLVTGFNQSTQKEICYNSCYSDTIDCSRMNISSICSLFREINRTGGTETNHLGHLENKLLNNSIRPEDQVTVQNSCLTEVLHLQYNLISSVENTEWKQIVNLEYMDLSGNRLIELPRDAFNLPSLVSLNISWNLIGSINNQSLSNLPALRSLDLSGNPLGRLSLAWFEPVTHLRYLHLSNCDIKVIPGGFGALFSNLEAVDFSRNQLQVINGAYLQHMSNISELIFNGNPLHCDCNLNSFQQWVINNSVPTEQLKCATPRNMIGQNIIEIPNLCNLSRFGNSQVNRMIPVYPTRNTQLPYDPMMGVGTAIVLSGMLVLFLLCVLLDKLKRKFKRWWRERSDKESQYSYSIGYLDSSSKLHTFPDDVFHRSGSQYKGSQHICGAERNSVSIQSSIDVFQKGLCVPRTSIDGKTEQYHSENVLDPGFTETHL